MTGAVDVVIAGHTHSHLNTRVPNREGEGDKLVIEANSLGIAYDRVRMTVDRASGQVLAKTGDTPPTWADEVAPEPHTAALVADHARRIAPLSERVVAAPSGRFAQPRGHARAAASGAVAARAQRRLAEGRHRVRERGQRARETSPRARSPTTSCSGPRLTSTRCCGWS